MGKFEDKLKQKLEGATAAPSDVVWQTIAAQIATSEVGGMRKRLLWYKIAVACLLVLSIGLGYMVMDISKRTDSTEKAFNSTEDFQLNDNRLASLNNKNQLIGIQEDCEDQELQRNIDSSQISLVSTVGNPRNRKASNYYLQPQKIGTVHEDQDSSDLTSIVQFNSIELSKVKINDIYPPIDKKEGVILVYMDIEEESLLSKKRRKKRKQILNEHDKKWRATFAIGAGLVDYQNTLNDGSGLAKFTSVSQGYSRSATSAFNDKYGVLSKRFASPSSGTTIKNTESFVSRKSKQKNAFVEDSKSVSINQSYNINMKVGRSLSKRVAVFGGLGYQQFNGGVSTIHTTDNVNIGTFKFDGGGEEYMTKEAVALQFISAQLIAGFNVIQSRIGWSINTGFSPRFLVGGEETEAGKGVNQIDYSAIIGTTINYKMTKYLALTLDPHYRLALDQYLGGKQESVNTNLQGVQLNLGIQYKF